VRVCADLDLLPMDPPWATLSDMLEPSRRDCHPESTGSQGMTPADRVYGALGDLE
jgi:hypothetical protein